jgi:hypothetical protein
MNVMRYLYGPLCMLIFTPKLCAQINSLFVNSQYAGVYAAQINPATAAQMKHKWVVSLAGLDAKIFNNYMSMNMPYHPYRLLFKNYPDSLRTSYNNPVWRWNWVQTNVNAETVSLHSFIKVSGPSAFVKYKNSTFGVLTELNVFADMKGMPTPLVDQFYQDLKRGHKLQDPSKDFLNNPQKIHLNIKQQSWVSIGLSYSHLWVFKRRKMLSAGITYKLLHARGGYQIQVDADELKEQADHKIKISSPGFVISTMMPRNNIFYPKGYGGIDIGVQLFNKKSETGRSNNSSRIHPDHLYKIGASILDIGNLVYTRTISTELQSRSEAIELPSVEDVMSWSPEKARDELMKAVAGFENVAPETFYGKTIKIGLPTRMVLHGDVQVNKHFYIDAVIQQNLRKRNGKNMNTFSYLTVSPRIENRSFTVGMPLSLDNNYSKLHIGFYARILWLYFGSRNIAALISPNRKQEADFFMGIQFGNLPGKLFKGKMPYMFMRKRGCAEF